MIKFFRRTRYNLLTNRKTGKYLKYAVGEIILVVIGILLALQINNWNENRKEQKELKSIYQEIVFDLDNDIKELSNNLEGFQETRPVFDKVFSDSRTVELLDDGLSRIIAGNPATGLNKSGIERLKNISSKDTLSMKIIDTYNEMESIYILPVEQRLHKIGTDLSTVFRDNYDWYPEWMSKRITKDNSSPELQDYFVNNREYRHYVIEYGYQVYTNYLPRVEYYISELKVLRSEIKNKIGKS